MSDELILDLETLTPIWTGDAFRKGDEIKSSGIMGSVRWWYETINRGLGRKVCNSTSVFSSCKLNGEEFTKSILKGKLVDDVLNEQEICPACKLFGCNDWSGKFRLIVEEYNGKGIDKFISIANRRNNYKRKVEGKLFTKEKPLRLNFQAIKEMSYEERELLKFTLNLIGEWAALGARTAQGNGVVKILNNSLQDSKVKLDDIVSVEHYNNSSCKKLPNLRDFFFSKFQICFEEDISAIINENAFWISQGSSDLNYQWKSLWEGHGFIPIAYHVRDTIRRIESVKSNKSDRHRIFGHVSKGCTKGSQIFVSHGYKIDDRTVEIRIWGYERNKDRIILEIKTKLDESLADNLFDKKKRKTITCKPTELVHGEDMLGL